MHSSTSRTISHWLPLATVFAGAWTIVMVYSYPGFMSLDSIEQLAQARGRAAFSDWHPPVMPLIWKPLDRIIAGPLLMVLLQCGLLVGGIYASLARDMRPWFAAVTTLAIFAWPVMLATMAVVWKDSLMAGTLVASFAALTSQRSWPRYVSVIGFLLASMLRHNAILAVLPMLVLLSPWPRNRGPWARRACGLALGIAVFVVAHLGNQALTEQRTYPFHNSLAVLDLAGTLRYAAPVSDAEIENLLQGVPLATREGIQERAIRAWSPYGWWSIVWGEGRLLDPPKTHAEREAIRDAWLRLIIYEPRAYLFARIRVFRELLGFTKRKAPQVQVFNAFSEDAPLLADYGIRTDRGAFQVRMSNWLSEFSTHSAIFRAWPYILVALALLVTLRQRPDMAALLVSALIYEAALFVVAPSPDLRYSHWLITCVLVAFAVRIACVHRPAMFRSRPLR